MSGTIAITMAGLGSRFAKAGFQRPKYEIEAHGIPLFDWSMLSLEAFRQKGWQFHFIARADLGAPEYIRSRAKALGISRLKITELAHVTDGQATTAYLSANDADPDATFAVYNIDTFVTPNAMVPPDQADCQGWIPCFPAPGDGWSFARLDETGRVVELREKQRISDHATVGLYWFDSAARYCELYRDYYADDQNLEKGERYIAPMYNGLIAKEGEVRISTLSVADVGMLGTPEQVQAFVTDPPHAAKPIIG